MAPLGVKVVTVVTGVVKTNIMTNSAEAHLPSGSAYASVEKKVIARSRGDDLQETRTPSDKFAEKVVGDVLGGAHGFIWRGQYASTIRLLKTWLPRFVMVYTLRSLPAATGMTMLIPGLGPNYGSGYRLGYV